MNPDKISEIVRMVSNLSVLLPLIIYAVRFRHAPRRVHIIGILIIVAGLCDLAGFIMYKAQLSTALLFNAYYALLFFLLSWFYYEILFISSRRVVVLVGFAVYLQSFLLVSLYIQGVLEYQTIMWIITGVIMIIYSIAYAFYSLSIPPNVNSRYYGPVWINAGVLVYFVLTLVLFALSNYVLDNDKPEQSAMLWSFHNLNNILKNILFGIGIYFYKKKNVDFTASAERGQYSNASLYKEPVPHEDILP
jgi:hypothetical protein